MLFINDKKLFLMFIFVLFELPINFEHKSIKKYNGWGSERVSWVTTDIFFFLGGGGGGASNHLHLKCI